MIVGDDIQSIISYTYVSCCYIQSNHEENIFHSHLHHPGQMPISEARKGNPFNSVVDISPGKRKMNHSKMWQLRPTKDRLHLGSLFASKITSMRKVQPISKKTYLLHPSSCFLLKPDATFFLFPYCENHPRLNAISFKCLQYIHITLCFILFHFEPIFLFFALLQT